MSNVARGFTKVTKAISKHSPLILSVFGAVSVCTTAVLAAKAAPKAKDVIDNIQEKIKDEEDPEATQHLKRNMYFDVCKLYLPAAVNGVIGIACIIGAHKINTNRQIALAATCALTEKKFEDYQEEVKNLIGEKEEEKVKQKAAEKTVESEKFKSAPVVSTGKGEILYFDGQSGRKFWSTPEKIHAAENELNRMRMENSLDDFNVNDFYDILEIDNTTSGIMLGWPSFEKNSQQVKITEEYSSCNDEFGREVPCCVIDFNWFDSLVDGIEGSRVKDKKSNKHIY